MSTPPEPRQADEHPSADLLARIAAVVPMRPAECYAAARPDPLLPPPAEGPIATRRLRRGRLAVRRLLHGDRSDQCAALWVPDGAKPLRGVIFAMHRASEAGRSDYHAVARRLGFAVYATLIRWANFERILPDQLAKLAEALGHPELATVPWAVVCGSRNVAASFCYALQDPHRDRILCLLTNGGPGIAADLDDRAAMSLFRQIPVMTVNGTDDEYTAGLAWFTDHYPAIRAAGLPWCAAPDWGGGHLGRSNGAMYWPFLQAVLEARYPREANPRKGRVRLLPFREALGRSAGPIDWHAPDLPAGRAKPPSVWFPSPDIAAVWRAYSDPNPMGRLVAQRGSAEGSVRLQAVGLPRGGQRTVRFFDGARQIGLCRARPFAIEIRAKTQGLQAIHATATPPAGPEGHLRPLLLAGEKVIDQQAGLRAADRLDAWIQQRR